MDRHMLIPRHSFSGYFELIAADKRLLPSHIGLIMALFYHQDEGNPWGFFHASRSRLMRFSRIRSIATYHKCLSEMVSYGYLEYIPSWHPVKASRFRFIQIADGDNNG